MDTFVSQIGRTKEGVHDGVDQHISVAVAGKPLVMSDGHAAQHQLSPFSQRMGVETDS